MCLLIYTGVPPKWHWVVSQLTLGTSQLHWHISQLTLSASLIYTDMPLSLHTWVFPNLH